MSLKSMWMSDFVGGEVELGELAPLALPPLMAVAARRSTPIYIDRYMVASVMWNQFL
jgi:hypothetical protein